MQGDDHMPDTENKQQSTTNSPPLGTPNAPKPAATKVMPTGVDEQPVVQSLGTPVAQKEK